MRSTPAPPRIRLALVDDHPVVVRGFEASLAGVPDIEVAARGGSVAEGAVLLARRDISVLLLDIRLPDGSGLALLARTPRESRPAVIVVSSFEARQYASGARRLGAEGFLLKTAPTSELVEAVRTVAAGGRWFAGDQPDGVLVSLTPRERDIVGLVLAARSNDEIAAALHTQRKTVETQLSRLYERLGVASRVELAVRAEREGWLEVPPAGRERRA